MVAFEPTIDDRRKALTKDSYKTGQLPVAVLTLAHYTIDVVTSSGILKAKQKLGVTFNFDK